MTDLDLSKIKEAVAGARHGPKGCLLLKTEDVAALIARLEAAEARNATAYAEGVEAAAAVHTAEAARLEKQIEENTEYMRRVGRSDHSANNHCHEKLRQHLYYAEAIRALLKDKPNG